MENKVEWEDYGTDTNYKYFIFPLTPKRRIAVYVTSYKFSRDFTNIRVDLTDDTKPNGATKPFEDLYTDDWLMALCQIVDWCKRYDVEYTGPMEFPFDD